jgi:hypothetical protein
MLWWILCELKKEGFRRFSELVLASKRSGGQWFALPRRHAPR